MRKRTAAAAAAAAVAAAAAAALASPLFYESVVDEAAPGGAGIGDWSAGDGGRFEYVLEGQAGESTFGEFAGMGEESRGALAGAMPDGLRDAIMDEYAAMPPAEAAAEDAAMPPAEAAPAVLRSGSFAGLAGHSASGTAKVIEAGGSEYLRFEDFAVTNGPDLRVYLTRGGDVDGGLHVAKLKGSRGDQNYPLDGIDHSPYDTVVVYCQPFGVHFGSAPLA